jgi:hypothetical protein
MAADEVVATHWVGKDGHDPQCPCRTDVNLPVPLVDYGLGTFRGKPIVMVNNPITIYHLRAHGWFRGGTTFTEDFARNGCGARPCRTCFPAADGATS